MLKIGGLFVFVEPITLKSGSTTLNIIEKVFPKDIIPSPFTKSKSLTENNSEDNDEINIDNYDDFDNLKKKPNKKKNSDSVEILTDLDKINYYTWISKYQLNSKSLYQILPLVKEKEEIIQ